jgi:hypothetical protein
VLDLAWFGAGDLRDAADQLDDLGEVGVAAHDVSGLGARHQRLARFEERRAAGLEQRGVAVNVVEQFVGQRLLGREVADQTVEPARQRLPGLELIKRGG